MTGLITKSAMKTRSAAELLAGLGKVVESSKRETYKYLSYTGREGRFTVSMGAGKEPEPFETNGKRLQLNLFETTQGYVCWKDGKVVDTFESSIFEPLPPIDSMTDHGPYVQTDEKRDGWKKQISFFLRDATSGEQYILKLSSPSATNSVGEFLGSLFEQTAMHDITKETPVITLKSESFKSNGFRNYKPIFELVDWMVNPTEETAAPQIEAPKAEAAAATEEKVAIPASRKK
ncbi:MAG: hypothetical protein ACKO0Z_07180 [Betaproteobacteria bacterium]